MALSGSELSRLGLYGGPTSRYGLSFSGKTEAASSFFYNLGPTITKLSKSIPTFDSLEKAVVPASALEKSVVPADTLEG